MLRIERFSKTYKGGKKAVDDLNLHVHAGDIYGFIGHNGAGKTTTLRAVAGILDFEEGNIFVDQMNIKEHPIDCKRLMAFIPDNPDIYEHMTGIQYLNFMGDIYLVPADERKELIQKFSQAFELKDALGDLVSSYSHGMRQKLTLIAALIHRPKLLLLDEPFVGLDPKAAHILKGFMFELCSTGSAIFFSTHVLDVAEKLCNKIAIIRNGKLVAAGDMEKVKGDQSLEELFLELIES